MSAPLRKVAMPAPPDGLMAWTARSARRLALGDRGGASMTDVPERFELEARLAALREEHFTFQRLVADIAAGFVRIGREGIGDAIDGSLHRIADALQLDEAGVWRKRPDASAFVPVHSWLRYPGRSFDDSIPTASIPWVMACLDAGDAASFARVGDVPSSLDRSWFEQRNIRSLAVLPLGVSKAGQSVLSLGSMTRECEMTPAVLERLRLVAGVIGQGLARRDADEALQAALEEVRTLRQRLAGEQTAPPREVRSIRSSRIIVSESSAIKRSLAHVEQVAPTPATVLLLGETGCGKEVFAQAIHDMSPRHQRPMVKVSCAAIPSALIESELFGRERGAYTGALSRQIGRFEAAHQSTLFLDEIGDLPADVQVKLLRVLQERVIERLGSTQSIKVDVRIIAATNRNLEKAVEDKTFREDLFYRLNVFPIVVPPLRERVEDIPGLVWAFIDELSKSFGKSIASISKDSIRDLQRYSWPGNVRELRNVIERAVIVATGSQLELQAPRPPARILQTAMTLVDLEVEHIRAVLESTNWRVRGTGGAAERLGLKPTTLESRMARIGLKRNMAQPPAVIAPGEM